MLRVLGLLLSLLVVGGAETLASDTQWLVLVDSNHPETSQIPDGEQFEFGGFTWILTDDPVTDNQIAGPIRWALPATSPGDRFFLVGDEPDPLVRSFALEVVGTIDGMWILRLGAGTDVVVPHLLAFHEIRPIGELVPPSGPSQVQRTPVIQSVVDAVDPDLLHDRLAELSAIQTRFCQSSYYEVAAQYVEDYLESFGWPVESQPVDASGYPSRNLIATKIGDTSPDTVVVLCGHLDSATYASFDNPDARSPGADDNGSTSVAILEAARILRDYSFRYTMMLVLFAAEEIGLYGSEVFADDAAAQGMNILCALNGDMLAYDSQGGWDVAAICNGQSSWVGDLLIATGATYTPDLVVEKVINPGSSSSDHRSFWNAGFTSTWLFEGSDSSPYIHSMQDEITTLNFPFYTETTKLFLATLAIMADGQPSVGVSAAPDAPTVALRHHPEPAMGSLHISFDSPGSTLGTLRIYDMSGRMVTDLGQHSLTSGTNQFRWSGRTASGDLAPSGVYLIRLDASGRAHTSRLTLLR